MHGQMVVTITCRPPGYRVPIPPGKSGFFLENSRTWKILEKYP